jgi:hypothetical protein
VQEQSVKDYVEKFEELKSLMNASLLESYYVSGFISGLKDDIKLMLKIRRPITLI